MKFDKLKMNRFMYRVSQNDETKSPEYVRVNSLDNSSQNNNRSNSSSNNNGEASEVITGTVIVSCLIQSSGAEGRVELNSYVTGAVNLLLDNTTPDFFNTDALVAYNDNEAVVIINKYGIFAVSAQVSDFTVVDFFNYNGVIQPVMYNIRWESGAVVFFPTDWTVVKTSVGEYTVTHNLAVDSYSVLVTPGEDNIYGAYSSLGLNDFIVNLYSDTGAAVDGDFSCVVFRNP